MFRVLFIGDVFGSPGRKSLQELLPVARRKYAPDLVVVNGENAAGGLGLSAKQALEMFALNVQVITTGNHVWQQRDLSPLLAQEPHVLRPANFKQAWPGSGFVIINLPQGRRGAIVNLLGRAFMDKADLDCPFAAMQSLLDHELKGIANIWVDFHAEATSEKQAFAWHFDGRLSAVLGTHTHVQTADERILPQGTAYISDLGMTGPHASVIGMEVNTAISRFLAAAPKPFRVAKDDLRLEGALVEGDLQTGRSTNIIRVREHHNAV